MTIDWTSSAALPSSEFWYLLAHNGSRFVAVSDDGASAYSDDTFHWTAGGATGIAPYRMAFGAGVFCAIENGSALAVTSPDGVTWTPRMLPSSDNWSAIVWTGALFVIVAFGTNKAATSPDGITWTARTISATANWVSLAWNGSVVVAIASGGTVAATSPTGVTWTARTLPSSSPWVDVTWNGSVFVAIAGEFAGSGDAASSPDGTTWTARALPESANWIRVVWDGAKFIALCDYDDPVATSTDGATWSSDTVTPVVTGWYAADSNESGVLVVIGYDSDTLLISGVPTMRLSDSADAATSTTGALHSTRDLADAAAITSPNTRSDVWPTLADTLGAADTLTPELLANLIDRLVASTSVGANATLAGKASDALVTHDTLMAAWSLLLAEEIATAGTAAGNVRKLVALLDALVASGQVAGQMQAFATCAAAMALEGLISQQFSASLVDSAALTDATSLVVRMLAPLVDGIVAADTTTPTLRISVLGSDSVAVGDDLAALLRANVDLADGLVVFAALRIGGTDYSGYCLNTALRAPSEYTGTSWDSIASFGGAAYAAGPNGLVQLTGTSDNGGPIDLTIRSFLTDFGTGKFKRVPDAFIGVTNAGELVLKVITRAPSTGQATEDWYVVARGPDANEGKARVQIGRGLKSTWWGYELVNVDGASLELDGVEMRPLALDRRT